MDDEEAHGILSQYIDGCGENNSHKLNCLTILAVHCHLWIQIISSNHKYANGFFKDYTIYSPIWMPLLGSGGHLEPGWHAKAHPVNSKRFAWQKASIWMEIHSKPPQVCLSSWQAQSGVIQMRSAGLRYVILQI